MKNRCALDAAVRKHASQTIRDIIITDQMKKHGLWPQDLNPIPNDLMVKNIRTAFRRILAEQEALGEKGDA